jgi:glycosyltransferase involved in cell wall biosynthesis
VLADEVPPKEDAAVSVQRILFLGHTFPPGLAELSPPPQRLVESCLVESIAPWFEVRRVAIADREDCGNPGVQMPWALTLVERKPEVWHRYRAIAKLQSTYLAWRRQGFAPDLIVMTNFTPIYNGFIRWLNRRSDSPPVLLYLADSTTLRASIPPLKRLRYRFKPFIWPDDEMVSFVHGCVSTSRSVGDWFPATGYPWHWLPNGIDPNRIVRTSEKRSATDPVRFGFFGALSEHTGIPALLRLFTAKARFAEIYVCGFGKGRELLEKEFGGRVGVHLSGPMLPDDCVRLGATCDVLVNPRPAMRGNDCNFSSKVLEYSLTGRAILSSKVSGVDAVLGPNAWYFDEHDFDRSLSAALDELTATPRDELDRRGAAIQRQVLSEFSWPKLGEKLAPFLSEVIARGRTQRTA